MYTYIHVYIIFRLKKKEILSVVTTWMNLEGILLNERSIQKEKYCMVSLIEEEVKSHNHDYLRPHGL